MKSKIFIDSGIGRFAMVELHELAFASATICDEKIFENTDRKRP